MTKTERAPGWWQVRRLRRATGQDLVALALLGLLATATIVSGRHAADALTPRSAIDAAALLDSLDIPLRLPDLPLVDLTGKQAPLLSWVHHPRAVVAFYAPWCGPCQKELPELVKELGSVADILVVTSSTEDKEETQKAIDNLELKDLTLLVDPTDQLTRAARVKGLPTAYLITRRGAVVSHSVGYSVFNVGNMKRLVEKAQ